jgi:hypothetical protein
LMNRHPRPPLRRRFKARSEGFSWRNILTRPVAIGGLITFGVALVFCLGAFYLASKPSRSKPSGPKAVASTTSSSTLAAKKETPASVPSPVQTFSPAPQELLAKTEPPAEKPLEPDPVPAVAPPAPTPSIPDPSPVAKSSEAARKSVERKGVERERREAERKRSRLEALYQKHQISDEAYKNGQDEYKSEIAKYRSALENRGPKNE